MTKVFAYKFKNRNFSSKIEDKKKLSDNFFWEIKFSTKKVFVYFIVSLTV